MNKLKEFIDNLASEAKKEGVKAQPIKTKTGIGFLYNHLKSKDPLHVEIDPSALGLSIEAFIPGNFSVTFWVSSKDTESVIDALQNLDEMNQNRDPQEESLHHLMLGFINANHRVIKFIDPVHKIEFTGGPHQNKIEVNSVDIYKLDQYAKYYKYIANPVYTLSDLTHVIHVIRTEMK